MGGGDSWRVQVRKSLFHRPGKPSLPDQKQQHSVPPPPSLQDSDPGSDHPVQFLHPICCEESHRQEMLKDLGLFFFLNHYYLLLNLLSWQEAVLLPGPRSVTPVSRHKVQGILTVLGYPFKCHVCKFLWG